MGCRWRDGYLEGCFHESGNSFINQSQRWKGSPTPQGEAAIVGRAALSRCTARLWCICSEGIQTFVGYSFCSLVTPYTACVVCRASVFTARADLLATKEISLWMAYFFIPADSRGEHAGSPPIALKAEPSDRAEAALPHSGPSPCSRCRVGMISNLDDFSTLSMKMECYLHRPALLPIYLT